MDLTSKTRYVTEENISNPPLSMTYSSVVSCDSVLLALLISAFNYLNILAGDIQNAYLNNPTKEKLFFYAGDEWKSDQGKVVVIVRDIYVLNSIALAWINHLSDIVGNHLGFQSSLSYPDFWFKEATDKFEKEYYTYIIVLLIVDKYSRKYISMLDIE